MKNIDLSLCKYSDKIALGSNGNFDYSKNGEFGYRVFYDVPTSEIDKLEVFDEENFEEGYNGGELEFSVDENGKQYGEVLLWCSLEDEECIENLDFVNYEGDISSLVEDFNNREREENEKGDR